MSDQPAFGRVLASLYDAMLDDTRWPAASALIDEACGLTGNGLIVADGPKDDVRLLVVGLYFRGQRHEDLERDYVENYHSMDERVPRFRQLPSSRLVHATDLYTAEELKTSPTYNELMRRAVMQDSLNVRLSGLDESLARERVPTRGGLPGPDGREDRHAGIEATLRNGQPFRRQALATCHETRVAAALARAARQRGILAGGLTRDGAKSARPCR